MNDQRDMTYGVLAGKRVVDLVIRAHDGPRSGSDSIREWPKVELMESDVVDVGTGIHPVMLLFVANEMLRASNDAGGLDALHSVVDGLAREIRIRAEPFPVAPALGRAAKRADHGAEHHIDALVVVLLAHGVAAVVPHLAVPRRSHGAAGGERRVVVGCLRVSGLKRRQLGALT
jgi:hypothetical protein